MSHRPKRERYSFSRGSFRSLSIILSMKIGFYASQSNDAPHPNMAAFLILFSAYLEDYRILLSNQLSLRMDFTFALRGTKQRRRLSLKQIGNGEGHIQTRKPRPLFNHSIITFRDDDVVSSLQQTNDLLLRPVSAFS
ncbi:hypothetical protein CHH65_18915 [Shouchella clausii]|nr:hypothetical protein CHH65_18915 [Shouchella clausii]